MVVAQITKDHLWEPQDATPSRAGTEFNGNIAEALIGEAPKRRFKCYDDDGELYYSGWLLDDSNCDVQFEVLRWCERDAGCTTIKVKIDKVWTQVIG